MGVRNGVHRSTNYGTERTPCVAAGSTAGHGVFRLHMALGFADDHVSLKMTFVIKHQASINKQQAARNLFDSGESLVESYYVSTEILAVAASILVGTVRRKGVVSSVAVTKCSEFGVRARTKEIAGWPG